MIKFFKFRDCISIILVLVVTSCDHGQATEIVDSNTMNLVSQSTSFFTSDLYNALSERKENDGNMVFSPYSLSSLLCMVNAGAKGEASKEITAALRVNGLSETTVYKGYHDLIQSLKEYGGKSNDVTLKIANTIFTDEKFTLKSSYLDTIRDYFESGAQSANFSKTAVAAAQINQWVSYNTEDKIKDLIKADSLSKDTKAVLVNAMYFKGDWRIKFDPKLTKPKPFYYNHTTKDHVMIDFMEAETVLSYGKVNELEATAVAIPYKGVRIVLCIVLPNYGTNFSEFEQKIRGFDISRIPIELPSLVPVVLSMPKFKMESTIDFAEEGILQKLGIKTVLGKGEQQPDLSGMTEAKDLYVSSVIQKSFIEINEDGTEAVAAGILNVGTKILRPPKPIVVQINRPFVGFVFDLETKSILFFLKKMK